MKTIYTLILILISTTSFSQTYRIYTAKKNGNWNDASTWNNVVRTDGVAKNKYIIPGAYTVTAPRTVDYTDYGDIQIEITGRLLLASNIIFTLTENSSIQVNNTGSFDLQGAGAVVIGNSWKLLAFTSRALDGPLFTDFITTGFASMTLSVHFVNFTAVAEQNNNVILRWSTSDEINNSHFEIEFSSNGKDWSKIGNVKAVERNSTINNYTFTHKNVNGSMASYRLKQVDKDEKSDYSDVAVVRMSKAEANVYASNKKIYVELANGTKSAVVKVLNTNGQVVNSRQMNGSSRITVDLNNLNKGTYVVHVINNDSQTAKAVVLY